MHFIDWSVVLRVCSTVTAWAGLREGGRAAVIKCGRTGLGSAFSIIQILVSVNCGVKLTVYHHLAGKVNLSLCLIN
jgi:hypothetical protein